MFLVDLRPKRITGRDAEDALEALDDEARLSRVANGAKALCKASPVYRAS